MSFLGAEEILINEVLANPPEVNPAYVGSGSDIITGPITDDRIVTPNSPINDGATAGQIWIQISNTNPDDTPIEAGGGLWRTDGFFSIIVYGPQNLGWKAVSDVADQLRVLYRGKNFDGVETEGATLQDIGTENQWYRKQFILFYYCDNY